LHAPGVFFSPSRNQVDNPRERRHLAPWAAELEK
jgi:nitrate reductase gamma subunit